MLDGVDLLDRIAHTAEAEMEKWSSERATEIDAYLANVAALMDVHTQAEKFAQAGTVPPQTAGPAKASGPTHEEPSSTSAATAKDATDRSLRITADSLNRLCLTWGSSKVKTFEDARQVKATMGATSNGSSTWDYANFMNSLGGSNGAPACSSAA